MIKKLGCTNRRKHLINKVIINSEVNYIGENIFRGCSNLESIEVDADNKKLCILYASSAKDFFKVSIRLTKPYVYNVKEIGELLTCTFLKRPRGSARGMNIEDVPGNIKSKMISGMELYVPKPSKYTQERDEILGKEKQFINPNYLGEAV